MICKWWKEKEREICQNWEFSLTKTRLFFREFRRKQKVIFLVTKLLRLSDLQQVVTERERLCQSFEFFLEQNSYFLQREFRREQKGNFPCDTAIVTWVIHSWCWLPPLPVFALGFVAVPVPQMCVSVYVRWPVAFHFLCTDQAVLQRGCKVSLCGTLSWCHQAGTKRPGLHFHCYSNTRKATLPVFGWRLCGGPFVWHSTQTETPRIKYRHIGLPYLCAWFYGNCTAQKCDCFNCLWTKEKLIFLERKLLLVQNGRIENFGKTPSAQKNLSISLCANFFFFFKIKKKQGGTHHFCRTFVALLPIDTICSEKWMWWNFAILVSFRLWKGFPSGLVLRRLIADLSWFPSFLMTLRRQNARQRLLRRKRE